MNKHFLSRWSFSNENANYQLRAGVELIVLRLQVVCGVFERYSTDRSFQHLFMRSKLLHLFSVTFCFRRRVSALPVEQQPSQWQQKSIRIKFYSEGWEYNRTNIIISESDAKINWPTPGQCQGFIKLSFQIVPCNWSSRPADRPRRSMLLARRPKPRDRLDDYI